MSYNNSNRSHSIKLYDVRNYSKGPFQDIAPNQTPGNASANSLTTNSLSILENAYYRALYQNSYTSSLLNLPPIPSSNYIAQVQQYTNRNIIWNEFEFSLEGSHLLVDCINNESGGANVVDITANPLSPPVLVMDGFSSDIEPTVLLRKKGMATESITNSNTTNQHTAQRLGSCFSTDGRYILVGTEDNEIVVMEKINNTNEVITVNTKLSTTLLGHNTPITIIKANPKYDVIASASSNNVALWIHCTNSD